MTREDANKRILLACKRTWNEKTCKEIFKALEQEPCEDAISRQAVLDLIADYDLSMGQVVRGIHALPSVKPQESTGHWIYDNIANNWRCDKCGETPKTMGYVGTADFMAEHFKFCNHCGCRMVAPQEGEYKE